MSAQFKEPREKALSGTQLRSAGKSCTHGAMVHILKVDRYFCLLCRSTLVKR